MEVETAGVVQRTSHLGETVWPEKATQFDAMERAYDEKVLGKMPIKLTQTRVER